MGAVVRDKQIVWEYTQALLRGDWMAACRIAWANPDQHLEGDIRKVRAKGQKHET